MRAKSPKSSDNTVFLNIPYDDGFRLIYLAYISGLIHLGLKPRATIEIPGGRNRSDKIFDLMCGCRYSIHDLSRVQLDRTPPPTPRFNMPFELGLAFAHAKRDSARHDWFIFETMNRRASKSLSDLSGIDPYIHQGTVEGVMRELGNAFVLQSEDERNSVKEMMKTYEEVRLRVKKITLQTGAQSLFEGRVFRLLCTTAVKAASHAF